LARGLVLVVIAFLFFSWLVPEDTQPQWIRTARSLPILQKTGDAIVSLLPDDPAAHLPGQPKEETQPTDQTTDQPPGQRSDAQDASKLAGSGGYGSGARRGLNQLFETSRGASN
jgi:membrane protein required for colicin V production